MQTFSHYASRQYRVYARLVQATDGNFYGTTYYGGANNDGTVFKITPEGTLTTLCSFCSQASCADGSSPVAGLVQATDGDFYGTTSPIGGALCVASALCGTVFEITPKGTLTTLYTFCSQPSCSDGSEPYGGVIQATDGILYGTTSWGGDDDGGTVYSLSVGLGPFVKTIPPAGKVGQEVGILGNNLTGATSVTFNGTSATFTVKSGTLILTHVPTVATTGTVQVTLPSGTLSSNVLFYVLK